MRRLAIFVAVSSATAERTHRLGREPRARSQQPLELAAGLEFLLTSKGSDHLLANASDLDDLQIGAAG
jgi:hypothetical protein